MHCPYCEADETKVIDSRLSAMGTQVRRRRECEQCSARFTTYEVVDCIMPRIIKRDGTRVAFDESKLREGFMRALEKRPVTAESAEAAIQKIVLQLQQQGEREVATEVIGDWVMDSLKSMDHVAYVRFASVYRRFQDVNAFHEAIKQLIAKEE